MKQQLKDKFNQLKQSSNDPQQRRFQFEKWIFELLEYENLSPNPSYHHKGEQIDGFFEFENRFFLLETKWAEPISVADIYIFRAKIEGKLSGTLGVFISVNGYTQDTPEVLRYGKELNVILFDGTDIELALADNCSFRTILKAKLRCASQYGKAYCSYKSLFIKEKL
jgi:hypothetical protein